MAGRAVVRRASGGAAALLVGVGMVVTVPPALAGSAPAPAGSTGHDVSYPQCAASGSTATVVGPLGGAFGIVGVTGGRPFSSNSCWGAEYGWAAGRAYQAGLYMNTANPAPLSTHYWPVSGTRDPALCANSASTTDPGCAYDYGWHAAADALSTARSAVAGAATVPWWLDVESANSWNGNGSANAADLQGAVDYLRTAGAPSVGIYSSGGDWGAITGGYGVADAAIYQAAWANEFVPLFPMSLSPTWVAGAGSTTTATSTCGTAAFTGVRPALAQYADGTGYDADLVCGPVSTPPPASSPSLTVSLASTAGTVKPGSYRRVTVSVSESGASQVVSLAASVAPAGPTVSVSPATLPGTGTATLTMGATRATLPGTYAVIVRATAGSATGSAQYSIRVR